MASCNSIKARRGETNEQVFSVLSLCFVVFLFLVVVHQTCLYILGMFRCCYIGCYMNASFSRHTVQVVLMEGSLAHF